MLKKPMKGPRPKKPKDPAKGKGTIPPGNTTPTRPGGPKGTGTPGKIIGGDSSARPGYGNVSPPGSSMGGGKRPPAGPPGKRPSGRGMY